MNFGNFPEQSFCRQPSRDCLWTECKNDINDYTVFISNLQKVYLNSSVFIAEFNELMGVLFLGSSLARCPKRD